MESTERNLPSGYPFYISHVLEYATLNGHIYSKIMNVCGKLRIETNILGALHQRSHMPCESAVAIGGSLLSPSCRRRILILVTHVSYGPTTFRSPTFALKSVSFLQEYRASLAGHQPNEFDIYSWTAHFMFLNPLLIVKDTPRSKRIHDKKLYIILRGNGDDNAHHYRATYHRANGHQIVISDSNKLRNIKLFGE